MSEYRRIQYAFPMVTNFHPEMGIQADPGMELRDWFAGQALASVISPILAQVSKPGPNECLILAATCYELADAMLAAREKQEPK